MDLDLGVAGALDAFDYGGRVALSVLALRALPFAVALAASRGSTLVARAAWIAAYLGVLGLAGRAGDVDAFWLIAAHAYFAVAAFTTHRLAPALRSRPAALALSLALYLIAPVLIARPAAATFAALGWELALCAYSYHLQASRDADRPTLRACMFFLLVDPTLVYAKRGSLIAAPGLSRRGLLRVLAGLLSVAASSALAEPLYRRFAGVPGGGAVVAGAAFLMFQYLAHSGRASVQIGLARQLGYRVAERYDFPILARSPAQFWRRWNSYVGDWARAFVFQPLAFAAARRAPRSFACKAGSVLAAFAAIGALHDLHDALVLGSVSGKVTLWFLCAGAVVLLWDAGAQRARALARTLSPFRSALAASAFGHACMAALLLAFAVFAEAR